MVTAFNPQSSVRTGLYFEIKNLSLFFLVTSKGAENLVKRKDSELRGQSLNQALPLISNSRETQRYNCSN